MTDKERKRGCKGCGSTCGMDGCAVCEDDMLCQHCERQWWLTTEETTSG